MQPVITPEESARLDALATEPVEVLMDRAGFAVAVAAGGMGAEYGKRVLVLCGPGNNGGDGYVAARYLAGRGADVEVLAAGDPHGDDSAARKAATAAKAAGVRVRPMGDSESADLVIDALFGAGFRGTLDREQAAWAESPNRVLAVDLPSGLDGATGHVAGPCFTAERTVTFHALKVGHLLGEGPDKSGAVDVVDIGLSGGDPELLLCEEADAARPSRSRNAHKWSTGSVMVVGGSPGIAGAAMLTARAALSFGSGAVQLACPAQLQPALSSMSPEIMTAAIGEGARFDGADAASLVAAAERYDVVVLGPGLGPDQEKFVASVLEARSGPVVLDADGLNAVHGPDQLAARTGPTIITPHAGEFERLTQRPADLTEARTLAEATDSVALLKGNPSLVVGSERWVVTSGGPELATIGTGDVLAGMVAALWARSLSAEEAARSAAFWHGRAAAALLSDGTVTAERLAATVGGWAW